MASDNFIVRIYRRSMPDQLVGQVEDVVQGRKQPFQSMEKLWRILSGSKSDPEQIRNSTVLKSNPGSGRSKS